MYSIKPLHRTSKLFSADSDSEGSNDNDIWYLFLSKEQCRKDVTGATIVASISKNISQTN